jgi:hypothetical protein
MAQFQPYRRLPAFLFLTCLFGSVHSQLNTSYSYANLSEAFPQLASFYTSHLKHSPNLGGRNGTRCCLQAVSESYIMRDGQPIQNPNSAQDYIDFPAQNLSQSQFPCGAAYDGDNSGAQPVVVPYSWCKQNCGGWEKSSNTALSQWVQPFVGFILPAAVFCLNVPRKSMFGIWDGFFKDHFEELPRALTDVLVELAFVLHFLLRFFFKKRKLERLRNWIEKETREGRSGNHGALQLIVHLLKLFIIVLKAAFLVLFRATFAAGIALVNTIVWVAVVFSAAGPMILSGLYEASLDRKVIRSIVHELKAEDKSAKKEADRDLPRSPRDRIAERKVFYKRIHQLYAILVGNLQLPPKEKIKDEPEKPRSVWKDVYHLVKPPRHRWNNLEDSNEKEGSTSDERTEPASREMDMEVDRQIALNSDYRKITDTRLKGMLDCQASFGAAVGAPVVFFVGSFLFGVISNLSAVGDNDTSHALAFGMWWMTIPHVAIVAGCLLAGNNPNTLEIIVSSEKGGPWEEGSDVKVRKGFRRFYLSYYQSVYVPVEMWARGKNKKLWIDELFFRYGATPTSRDAEGRGRHVARHNKGEFHFDLWDWIWMVNITIGLMVLPFVLAFLTSYYTPTVGVSCRTFTFLLYFIFQICLGTIWLFDFFTPFVWTKHVAWLPFGTYVEERSLNQESENESTEGGGLESGEVTGYVTKTRNNAPTTMGFLLSLFFLGSMFTTVVGTFLQILGVYRNCLCTIPISYWVTGDYLLDISTNTAQAIHLARVFWVPTGIASIVLMIITCYIGWWYQRHWRHQFNSAVKALLEPKQGSIHDPKAGHGGEPSPKLASQTEK